MPRRSLNGLILNGQRIQKLGTPTVSDDAATKAYADALLSYKQIATSGDLSANPAALVTFLGLDAYTEIVFDFAAVGHDYTSANQALSFAVSLDGSTWAAANAFTPSISSNGTLSGLVRLLSAGSTYTTLDSLLATNTATSGQSVGATSNPRIINIGGSKIVGFRIGGATGGNLNKGSIPVRAR